MIDGHLLVDTILSVIFDKTAVNDVLIIFDVMTIEEQPRPPSEPITTVPDTIFCDNTNLYKFPCGQGSCTSNLFKKSGWWDSCTSNLTSSKEEKRKQRKEIKIVVKEESEKEHVNKQH